MASFSTDPNIMPDMLTPHARYVSSPVKSRKKTPTMNGKNPSK